MDRRKSSAIPKEDLNTNMSSYDDPCPAQVRGIAHSPNGRDPKLPHLRAYPKIPRSDCMSIEHISLADI
jgi:hypothetical protein